MFPREQRPRQESDKRNTSLLHTQSQEQLPMDHTINTTPASVYHSSSRHSSLFLPDQDHDIIPRPPVVFGAEGHLTASAMNIDDNANESVGPNRLHQFLHQNSPWVPDVFTTDATFGNSISFTRHDGQSVYRGANHHFPPEYREAPASAPESHANLVQTHHSFPNYPFPRISRSAISTIDNADDYYDYEDHSLTDDVMDSTTFQEMSLDQNSISLVVNDSFSNFGSEIDVLSQTPLPNPTLPVRSLQTDNPRKMSDRTGKRKQFFCDVPGCSWTRGFQSDSDLDRHKRGRHSILSKSRKNNFWQCRACLPGKNGSMPKLWDRLDNFRNHCRTAHPNEDLKVLIQRSELNAEELAVYKFANQQNLASVAEIPSAQYVEPESEVRKESSLESSGQKEDMRPPSSRGKPTTQSTAVESSLPAGDTWDPFATVAPHSISVHAQPTEHIVSLLEETSSPLSLSTSPLLLGEHTPVNTSGQEDSPSTEVVASAADQEDTLSYTLSADTLARFETDLLQAFTETLKLDDAAKEQTRLLLAGRFQQLIQGARSTSNEGTERTSDSSYTSVAGSVSTSASKRGLMKYHCQKEDCGSSFERQCELTKHEKRHVKPWVCVWRECVGKSFGSKADWKRHEASRHLAREVFRCSSKMSDKKMCIKEFPRSDQYQIHLKKDHNVNEEAVLKAKTDNDRQLKDLPSEYWCGFCRHMEPYCGGPEEMWNRRIDHIEKHFQEKLSHLDWLPEPSSVNDVNQQGSKQGISNAAEGSQSMPNSALAGTSRQRVNKRNKAPKGTARTKRHRAEHSNDDDDGGVSAVSLIPRGRSNRQP